MCRDYRMINSCDFGGYGGIQERHDLTQSRSECPQLRLIGDFSD